MDIIRSERPTRYQTLGQNKYGTLNVYNLMLIMLVGDRD